MRRILSLLKLGSVSAVLVFGGCAATQAALQISKANKAVDRAKAKGAPEYAIYEYTMAENYLEKAREEAGYSDFKDSVTLAQGAAEWADKAIIVIEEEGRGLDLDSLPGETRTLTEEDRATGEPPPIAPDEQELKTPEASAPESEEAPSEEKNDKEALPDLLLPPSAPPPKGETEPSSGDAP